MEAPSTPARRDSSPPRAGGATIRAADLTVAKFAQLLGTKPLGPLSGVDSAGHNIDRSKALLSLLSNRVTDDDVVLVIPSLAMRLPGGASTLPSIGETHKDIDKTGPRTISTESEGRSGYVDSSLRPRMAASVLTAASNEASSIDQNGATSVSKQTSWTRSTVVYASQAVASNSSDFFGSLVDSRLRSWTLLLLRHSLSTGNGESRARLLRILSATLKVEKTETNFKTLTLPESARSQPKEADVILPLLFEITLSMNIQGEKERVVLRSPGTISAYLESNDAVTKVIIRLDTGVLLSTMVDQVRLVVFKAVANAMTMAIPESGSSNVQQLFKAGYSGNGKTSNASSDNEPKGNLTGFRSALSLTTPTDQLTPSLQKARSSALKLNSVLYGKSSSGTGNGNPLSRTSNGPTLGERRNRSLKWDSPLQRPLLASQQDPAPDPKKLRMAENAAKLKSFKSFGRPHAGVFGSGPRNATFGEYNRAHLWGRDGRMAHHPMPMQSAAHRSQLEMGPVAPDKNATFDLLSSSRLKRQSGSRSPVTGGTSLPRSATDLELILMKSSGSGLGL